MAHERFDLRSLDDRQVLEGVMRLHQTSAEVMADLLCHLAEVERRELYLREGCASAHKYAVEVLHCSEDEAWRRTHAARTAARFPVIFERIARGELTLTAVNKLAEVLTEANHVAVLDEARHKTTAQVVELVVRLAPRPDVASRLARLPEPKEAARGVAPAVQVAGSSKAAEGADTAQAALGAVVETPAPAPSPMAASVPGTGPILSAPAAPRDPARLEPLGRERWGLRLTIGPEAQRAARKAMDLTGHGNVREDLVRVVERALIEYAERLERKKTAKLKDRRMSAQTTGAGSTPEAAQPASSDDLRQRPTGAVTPPPPPESEAKPDAEPPPPPAPARDTRIVDTAVPDHRPPTPRSVRRAVYERDGGRCTYEGPDHRRCSETRGLELHHRDPVARGGQSTVDGLRLLCRVHHRHQTLLDFGEAHIAAAIERRRGGTSKRDRSHSRRRV